MNVSRDKRVGRAQEEADRDILTHLKNSNMIDIHSNIGFMIVSLILRV
jgi:hypothetical protein